MSSKQNSDAIRMSNTKYFLEYLSRIPHTTFSKFPYTLHSLIVFFMLPCYHVNKCLEWIMHLHDKNDRMLEETAIRHELS